MPLRIIIADDHGLFRAGLAELLRSLPDVGLVVEVADGMEAVDAVRQHSPDMVLLDVSMPRMNGIEAAAVIKRDRVDVHVIMISMHEDEAYVTRALRAGADGYLLKGAAVDELQRAIDSVQRGQMYLSPSLSRPVLERMMKGGGIGDPQDRLTPRQREVLKLVGEGYTTKEIGTLLHISPRTVESHRKQLMRALDVSDLAGMVLASVRLGLVNP